MEQEILEELEQIYKNFNLEVEFIDFRQYKIKLKFILNEKTKAIEFMYTWDVKSTNTFNFSNICYNIDKLILKSIKEE